MRAKFTNVQAGILTLGLFLGATACDDGAAPRDASTTRDASLARDAASDFDAGSDSGPPARTYPAACQVLALLCPDAASLDACESGGAGFEVCTPLPLTRGCAAGTPCASRAQLCRTAEDPAGYCTRSCTADEDCPLEEGGLGTCREINPGMRLCVRP